MKRAAMVWLVSILVLASAVFANPIFSGSTSSQTVTAGQIATLDLSHTLADNGTVVAGLTGAPSFVSIASLSTTSVRLTISPPSTQGAATFTFTATVKDTDNILSQNTVTLTVLDAPVVGLTSTASVKLGGDRQRASNLDAQSENDRIVRLSGSITLKNSGANTVSGISAAASPVGFSAEELNFSFDPARAVPTTLNVGQEAVVGFFINVPGSLDAVDASTLKEIAFKAASITFSGTINAKPTTATSSIEMQRENKLEVDKVSICINDRCKSVDDGDDIDGIRPGDQVTIEIFVENKYSDSDREDVDFEDVDISYEIDDSDFSEDDSESLGDLGADDEDSETFSFAVDDDVDDGTYDLVTRVSGTDENGALHGEEIEVNFEVERESHDIEIRSATLNPSKLSCGTDTARVTLNFANIGKRDEDEVVVEVSVDELGISERIGPFELDEDDTRQESVSMTLPANVEGKDYPVVVRSLYDTTVPSDERVLSLTVEDCDGSSTSSTSTPTGSVTVTPPATQTGTQQVPVTQTPVTPQRRAPVSATTQSNADETSSFTDSTWYVALLAIGALVILGVLVVLVVKALGKSTEEL